MKTLLASFLFQQHEQAMPFFTDYINAMSPKPERLLLFDFTKDKKFSKGAFEIPCEHEKLEVEKDFTTQLCRLRNSVFARAKNEGFDAVLFLSPNIFPPSDLLARLQAHRKEIIAPAFFTEANGAVFSNALKLPVQGEPTPFLFEEFLPSSVKKVDSVLFSAVLFSKKFFEQASFEPAQDALKEAVILAAQAKQLGLEIFIDSTTVCARLSQKQLFSHHYFAAQEKQI